MGRDGSPISGRPAAPDLMNSAIPGVVHTAVRRRPDERGFFSEIIRTAAVPVPLVQANHSHSKAGVVRGLHYHRRQGDLWYVASGHIRVALADLRHERDAPATALVEMSADDPATLFIPPGVAHGFAAVTDCDLIYWVTHEFDDTDEFGIAWDDQTLAIGWGLDDPTLSERDRSNPPLRWADLSSVS